MECLFLLLDFWFRGKEKKPGDPLTCRIIACVEVIYNEHLGDGFKT